LQEELGNGIGHVGESQEEQARKGALTYLDLIILFCLGKGIQTKW
jgi:hypothetical protein